MRQRATEHVGDDLHVAVTMRPETSAGRDVVVVDHPQVAKTHVFRVMVVGEREAVKALQPSVIGVSTIPGFA